MQPYGTTFHGCLCCGDGAILQSKHGHRYAGTRKRSRRPHKRAERARVKREISRDLTTD